MHTNPGKAILGGFVGTVVMNARAAEAVRTLHQSTSGSSTRREDD